MGKILISKHHNIKKTMWCFVITSFLLFLLLETSFSAPITFTTKKEMDFGEIVNGDSQSVFTLSTNGIVTKISGDATYNGGAGSGVVRIRGDGNKLVNLTITPVSDLAGPGNIIPITLYTTNSPVQTKSNALIGATITVGANQATGTYTGSYIIEAEYQDDLGTFYTSNNQLISLEVIGQPIITEATPMSFGKILPDLAGGTITLKKNGAISNTSGNAIFLGGHQLGSFNITGAQSSSVSISFSTGDTLTGAGNAINLHGLGASSSSVNLGNTGTGSVNVYGSITYNAGQVPDLYQGIYYIYVDY